ncbi:DNA-binding transcriptional LysR family regulator [Paraburkholderia eburnea]|uniref:DNA-binding transcriptional LysR family regulator n=1 Tax=Paraburkholderia eburnea TaxID=1189126 RepID=A0A2S4M8R3_9BURK|nr:LysR family transcriptional regulator [Paraburkholderia eburnea]POR51084.1 DNA-binding transcriptional LysR family regulator [Paraburkholderia eburnea]PRZ21819.1 DNA-binding transcriptional LysR family regulator [Paraburkholderia eburnea]
MQNRLEMLRIFVAAAESESFKAAAAQLGISPQAVTRAVQDLERLHGEVLFHRSTRGIQVTTYGEALANRAKTSVRELDELFLQAPQRQAQELEGIVRLTAPVVLGRRWLMPVLENLSNTHPLLRFDLHLSDARAAVVDDRIDIGVRYGPVHDNRFVARRVAAPEFRIVGTPDLIARHGKPVNIEQLNDLPTTALRDISSGKAWPWYFADGDQLLPASPRFASNDGEAECQAILAGMGFGQIPAYLADQYIADGSLVPVLERFTPEPWEIYVYRPQRGPVPARVRLVFDSLVAAIAKYA